jgi:hypothetical protein
MCNVHELLSGVRLQNMVLEEVQQIRAGVRHGMRLTRALLEEQQRVPTLFIVRPRERSRLKTMSPTQWLFKDGCLLQFVCEGCLKPAACGEGGEGYLLDEVRGWVKTCAPVLLFSMQLIKLVSKAAAVPLPDLGDGALTDALDSIAGALSVLGGDDDDDGAEDDAMQNFVLANYASNAMDAATGAVSAVTSDDLGFVKASKQKQRRAVGTAYRRLAELIRKKDPSFPDGAFPCELVEVEQGEADDGTRAHKWLCERCNVIAPVPVPAPSPPAPAPAPAPATPAPAPAPAVPKSCCTMSKKCTIS